MNFIVRFILLFCVLLAGGSFAPIATGAFVWERITIKGREYVPVDDIRTFYGFTTDSGKSPNSSIRQEGSWRIIENKHTQIKLRPHSQEMRMNGLLFILSHPVIQDANGRLLISKTDVIKIVDPILRPNYIKSAGNFNTVILDPGHGGHDAGATNHLMRESDLNLKLARMLKPMLEKAGFKVVMTRDRDFFLTLQQRVQIANRYRNAIFISIHFNDGGKQATGIETFTLTPTGTASTFKSSRSSDDNPLRGNAQDSANIALATAVQGTVQRKLGAVDRGIKRARFSVLCGIQHPAILFEGGFLSHPRDTQLLGNTEYLNKMAIHMTEAVVKYKRVVSKTK